MLPTFLSLLSPSLSSQVAVWYRCPPRGGDCVRGMDQDSETGRSQARLATSLRHRVRLQGLPSRAQQRHTHSVSQRQSHLRHQVCLNSIGTPLYFKENVSYIRAKFNKAQCKNATKFFIFNNLHTALKGTNFESLILKMET